jgi:hypothetical protein
MGHCPKIARRNGRKAYIFQFWVGKSVNFGAVWAGKYNCVEVMGAMNWGA